MKNDLLERLVESREQLIRLKAINCRMAHERVLFDRHTQLPVLGPVSEIEFERVGLCDVAKRYENPACSHTIARYPIENAIDILEQRTLAADGETGEWRGKLNELNNAIHLLDHEKGEAEKQSARIIEKIRKAESKEIPDFCLDKELSSINKQIAEMERIHSIYVLKIEKLKNDVLAQINSAIEYEEKTSSSVSKAGKTDSNEEAYK